MTTKDKSVLCDLQYFLDNDSKIIASDSKSGKRLLVKYESDSEGEEWSVVFQVRYGSYSKDFDTLTDAVVAYNNF